MPGGIEDIQFSLRPPAGAVAVGTAVLIAGKFEFRGVFDLNAHIAYLDLVGHAVPP
jgi:hypothetical protein